MKLGKRSMSRNMVTSLISQAVTLVAGLVVQRYILLAYGSTYNGLTSLVTQIMSYLVLLEAGLVVNHTDILILSIVDTLKQVSVYSAYNMIYSHLGTVVQTTFMQAPQGDFGQLYSYIIKIKKPLRSCTPPTRPC